MSEGINPELIEKAAKALADDWNPERDPILSAMFRDYAQTALCAVLPYVIRQANPYRSERNESPDENPVLVAMAEYGEAIRGDWSDFDGSSEQGVIDGWVQELRHPDPSHDIEWHRRNLGICMAGGGHWCGRWGWCDDECGCVPCAEGRSTR